MMCYTSFSIQLLFSFTSLLLSCFRGAAQPAGRPSSHGPEAPLHPAPPPRPGEGRGGVEQLVELLRLLAGSMCLSFG